MSPDEIVIADPADVARVLTDGRFRVPAAAAHGVPLSLAWLRGKVARFCDGADHARRRAIVERLLDAVDPGELAAAATAMARASVDEPRRIPVRALATALGAAGDMTSITDAVYVVAAAYQPGASGDAIDAADRAVPVLADALGGDADEALANRIGLLVQTAAATAALVDNLLAADFAVVDDVLAHDPPVRATRRIASEPLRVGAVDVGAGDTVAVQLAGELAFGAGAHRCPGERHARAMAAAVVAAVR